MVVDGVLFEITKTPLVSGSFIRYKGVARIFQRGGGGCHTVSNIIVMAFSPRDIIGCFLKKGLQRGGGVTGTPGPPSLLPCGT